MWPHAAARRCFRRGAPMCAPACPRIHQPVGRDDLGAPFTCREAPGGAPARRAHRFCCQKRWENHQGLRALDPESMAAVRCTDRAETGPALPPVLSALTLQALPRLGWHASRLPCKPCKGLRYTSWARRAAAGTMPPKYHGVYGGLKTARQGCRALHRRPKLRIVRFRASPKAHSLRWASSPHDDHSVGSPRGPHWARPRGHPGRRATTGRPYRRSKPCPGKSRKITGG